MTDLSSATAARLDAPEQIRCPPRGGLPLRAARVRWWADEPEFGSSERGRWAEELRTMWLRLLGDGELALVLYSWVPCKLNDASWQKMTPPAEPLMFAPL